MLFDTPLLDNPKPSTSASKQDATPGHKRRRSSVGDHSAAAPQPVTTEATGMSFDVNKLLQKMQDQAPKTKSGKAAPAGAQPKNQQDGPSKKRQREDSSTKSAPTLEQKPQAVAAPVTPAGEGKRAKKSKKKAAAAALPGGSSVVQTSEETTPLASTSQSTTTTTTTTTHEAPQVVRHSAPSLTVVGSTLTGSTKKGSVQDKLRAQLAGGKFRMLNEQLYTTSGDDAHRLMKEDGAFDDYHIGFRSQAATWPVHPLALIAQSLLNDLPPNSLIADFGCGDAALARTLCPPSSSTSPSTVSQLPPIPSLKVPAKAAKMKQLKVVSFDLVSQSSYVVEAECSSVPLPGGVAGGEIVDAVVCCLSLMGTDWIRMLREARRVLKEGGCLKIAEVSSRFTSFDDFVKLVKELGFSLANRNESNTHFVLFDFVKLAGSDGFEHPNKVTEHDRKAATLLNPCIYKRR